jgi:hypothetical protein
MEITRIFKDTSYYRLLFPSLEHTNSPSNLGLKTCNEVVFLAPSRWPGKRDGLSNLALLTKEKGVRSPRVKSQESVNSEPCSYLPFSFLTLEEG